LALHYAEDVQVSAETVETAYTWKNSLNKAKFFFIFLVVFLLLVSVLFYFF